MSGWFDIGVNLTDPRLDVEPTLSQAAEAGVTHMAITGTDEAASQAALSLCQNHPNQLVCTAGVHPHYAKDVSDDYLSVLRDLSSHDAVVAIGECGLDFNRNFSPPEVQLRVFEQQLQLACDVGLPVFLHERDAHAQQIALLQRYRDRLSGGVAHCFTGDRAQMDAYLQLDLYIGITGWVCDPRRGQALAEAVTHLPLERLLLETDAPYLKPRTLSGGGRDNVPANLPHIGAFVAERMGVSVEQVLDHSRRNALSLLGAPSWSVPCN
ncbi:TatD family hydrolase [Aestuariibacter halophilus]|uniref:TatD family hydrolase n=1 Tax=Fluctibacter halophilus TaxID=226011 RepID=A0ABS8G9F4_9ALTE|nr:TatD family hydrolase [Aestuariibacter halophilus]MCC2617204.1 TatD family hydrolase [Aestuariibacter halophilus]